MFGSYTESPTLVPKYVKKKIVFLKFFGKKFFFDNIEVRLVVLL